MKIFATLIIPIFITLMSSSGSTAVATDSTTLIAAPPTLVIWSKQVFSHLDQALIYPAGRLGRQASVGIVAVKFNCSESGAPAGVTLYKSSGHRDLDTATVRAVSRIATLHPLPTGMVHDQKFVVRVLFADSPESADRQIAQMEKDARSSNAWFGTSAPTATATLEIVPTG